MDHTAGFEGAGFDVTPVGIAGVDAVKGACGALTCAGSLRCGGSRRDVVSGEIAELLLIFAFLCQDLFIQSLADAQALSNLSPVSIVMSVDQKNVLPCWA